MFCCLSPQRGSNRPAQGRASRRSPRSAALGIDESITVALKGQNNESHPIRGFPRLRNTSASVSPLQGCGFRGSPTQGDAPRRWPLRFALGWSVAAFQAKDSGTNMG